MSRQRSSSGRRIEDLPAKSRGAAIPDLDLDPLGRIAPGQVVGDLGFPLERAALAQALAGGEQQAGHRLRLLARDRGRGISPLISRFKDSQLRARGSPPGARSIRSRRAAVSPGRMPR